MTTVIFFAGGGTNSATTFYSAQTLGKISLIKSIELLDYEIDNIKAFILGPGWVKTKIHSATLKAKEKAGANYKKNLTMLESPEKLNSIPKKISHVHTLMELPKHLVGGRNFASVNDEIKKEKLERLFGINKDFYKLRRLLNDK